MLMKLYTLFLMLGVSTVGFAQEDASTSATQRAKQVLTKSEIGVGFNIVDADQLGDTVLGFVAYGDYLVNENVSVGLTADYWSESSGTLATQQVEVSDFSVGINTKYRFTLADTPRLTPYAGVGGALHRFAVKFSERREGDGNVIDPYEEQYQDVEGELGADLMGGVSFGIAENLDLAGQVRFRNILDADVELDQFVIDGSVLYKL